MKRYEAIEVISAEIIKDGLVDTLFLKGSIARNEDDDYSDVDMYAVVSSDNRDAFLSRRINYLEKYLPLVYYSEANFVGPQIVGVFENLLHFDLYTVDINAIPQSEPIKILFDENDILSAYTIKPLRLSFEYMIKEIDNFSFVLLEFEAAYVRKDLAWAIHLFGLALPKIACLVRYVYDEDKSMLGLRRLNAVIPEEVNKEILEILNMATPNNILDSMKMLLSLTNRTIEVLPNEVQNGMNKKFYNLMRCKIENL